VTDSDRLVTDEPTKCHAATSVTLCVTHKAAGQAMIMTLVTLVTLIPVYQLYTRAHTYARTVPSKGGVRHKCHKRHHASICETP